MENLAPDMTPSGFKGLDPPTSNRALGSGGFQFGSSWVLWPVDTLTLWFRGVIKPNPAILKVINKTMNFKKYEIKLWDFKKPRFKISNNLSRTLV